MTDSTALPTIRKSLCTSVGLYADCDISNCTGEDILKLERLPETIDAYCIECAQTSVFQKDIQGYDYSFPPPSSKAGREAREEAVQDRDFEVRFACSRDTDHTMVFYFRIQDRNLSKIGQYPSLADLRLHSIEKYRAILDKQQYKELARAIGLYAHGIGIGSYVYLRRIFEYLIETAHQRAANDSGWNDADYSKKRMDEKIALLNAHLPEALVTNATLYSILSKGIHSLSEDECLAHFDIVRTGIELILDEEVARREKEHKEKNLASQIARLGQQLGRSTP